MKDFAFDIYAIKNFMVKCDFFEQLCRLGILDTSNEYILKMYNACISFDTHFSMKKDLDILIALLNQDMIDFNTAKFNLYLSIRRKEK